MTGSLQIKKDMYYAVLNLYDADGRRKQKWISTGVSAIGNNKREANTALRRILDQYESGKVVGSESVRFAEYVRQWLEGVRAAVDPVTWDGYKSYVEVHIAPYFERKGLRLDNITARHIEDYYTHKLKDGRADGKGGLSPSSIKKHAVIIHGALKEALKNNLIPYNPADRAQLPRQETRFVGSYYSVEQAKALLDVARGTPIDTVIVLALYYGMRRSEICGMKWSAIDLDRDTVSVNHTVVKLATRIEKDRTKNKASCRSLPLLHPVREHLLELGERQQADKLMMGACYHETDYICRWPDGRPLEPDYITRKFQKVIKAAKLPVIRLHDLRHTTATMLLTMGFGIKDIGDWLGHSDYATTANIYAHLDVSRKKEIGRRLSDKLAR